MPLMILVTCFLLQRPSVLHALSVMGFPPHLLHLCSP